MHIRVQTGGTLCYYYREPGLSFGSGCRNDWSQLRGVVDPRVYWEGIVPCRGRRQANCSPERRERAMFKESGDGQGGWSLESKGERGPGGLGRRRACVLLAADGVSVFIARALTDLDG